MASYPADGNVALDNQTNKLAYALFAKTVGTVDYNATTVSLPFQHKLAKVRVVLTGDQAEQGEDVKIKAFTSCILNPDGTLTNGSTEGFIPMVKTTDNNGTKCWEANVVPGHPITEFQMNHIPSKLAGDGITPVAAAVNTMTLTVNEWSLQPEDGQFTIDDGDDVLIKNYDGSDPIVVNGNATITIRNVKLTTTGNVMTINNGATVTLNVEGTENVFTSTGGAGIMIMETTDGNKHGSITINGTGTNASSSKLKVTAGKYAAIGFRMFGGTNKKTYYGNINIDNITLEAHGGSGSPAIGISTIDVDRQDAQKIYGKVSINGSTVNAYSTGEAACIGTPRHATSSPFTFEGISITSSTVTATADGNQAACIGFGYTAYTGNKKEIIS